MKDVLWITDTSNDKMLASYVLYYESIIMNARLSLLQEDCKTTIPSGLTKNIRHQTLHLFVFAAPLRLHVD